MVWLKKSHLSALRPQGNAIARGRRFGRAIALRTALVVACLAPLSSQAFEAEFNTKASKALNAELRAVSLILTAERDKVTNTLDVLAAAQAEYSGLLSALYRAGHFGGTISVKVDGREAATIPALDVPKSINRVVVTIDPGPAFTFGTVTVGPIAPKSKLVLPRGFASGAPAQSGVLKEAATTAVQGWRDSGHAKSAVAGQRVSANHNSNTLDAAIAIEPGPVATFGRLSVVNSGVTVEGRVHEIAGIKTGRVYSPQAVERLAARLRRTGVFKSVSVSEAEALNADNSLDLTVSLVEEKPRRYGFGVELNSAEGGKLSGYWLHRNTFRQANRLRFDAALGGIGSSTSGQDLSLKGRLERPGTFWSGATSSLTVSYDDLDEPLYASRKINAELGLDVVVSPELTASGALGLRFARETVGAAPSVDFRHLTFPLKATWDRRDVFFDTKDGFYIGLDAMPYLGLMGSESGARIYSDIRGFKGFGNDDAMVAAFRFQVGSVLGSSIAGTPSDLLFFSGGGGSVRGQPYQSLGYDNGLTVTGGRSFLGLSGELRAKISENIGIVSFYDAGMIGGGSLPGTGDFHAGAGLGMRYETAIGPIRFDVALPVAGSTGDGLQFYIGIGQAF